MEQPHPPGSQDPPAPRFAARCLYLQMTFGGPPDHGLVNICHHIIREGSPCIGPFLDDTETPCGLWEPKPAGLLRGFEPTGS